MNLALRHIADTQFGLFTSAQAQACGYSLPVQAGFVRRGSWQRLTHGVLVEQRYPPSLLQKCQAVTLVCGAGATISGRASLALRGVLAASPVGPLSVVVPRTSHVNSRAGFSYRRGEVSSRIWKGVRVASVPDSLFELARFEPVLESVPIIDECLRRGFAALPELQALWERLPAGARGARSAREAIDRSDARAESPPESRVRLVLQDAGFVDLVPQYEVRDGRGRFLGRVDLALPALKIAIEYDGRAFHDGDPERFVSDRRRQNELINAGWIVLRFTAEDLKDSARIVRSLQTAISRATA